MTEHDEKQLWMVKYCKRRGYNLDWGLKLAEEAWNNNQDYLAKIRAEYSCWYCQRGMGQGLLALRDVPEPPDWESTLCEKHAEQNAPVHADGDNVSCEICGKSYKYLPWNRLMGRQDKRCYCRVCVSKFPERTFEGDRLVEGEPDELDHLTNFEKTRGER